MILPFLALMVGLQPTPQAVAVPVVRNAGPPPVTVTGDRADIAMKLAGGLPTVEVMIGDRGPFTFAVDTGASGHFRLSPELAQSLALQQVGEAVAGDPSGVGQRRVPLYELPPVKLGGLSFQKSIASPLPMTRKGIDGILGINLFDALLLTLDYGKGRLTAEKGALPPPDGKTILQAKLDARRIPSVDVGVGGKTYLVHLYSGNTRFPFIMPTETLSQLPTKGEPRDIGTARTVSQTISMKAISLAQPVEIGSLRLPVREVGYPAVSTVGNLGSLALTGLSVTIDMANRRVRILPSS